MREVASASVPVRLRSPNLDKSIAVPGDDRRIQALIEVVGSAHKISREAAKVAAQAEES